MAPMLGPDGKPLAARGWYDTESLAMDGGTLYVGIERVNRIVRFDFGAQGLLARGEPIAVPPGVSHAAEQQGARMPGVRAATDSRSAGTLIAISERGLDADGNIKAFLIGGAEPGRVHASGASAISTSAIARSLPAGDLLLLERSFSRLRGVGMRIRRVRSATSSPARWSTGRCCRRRHGLSDRQYGRAVGAPRRQRRRGADADLGRQFLVLPAHAAAAVHAGGEYAATKRRRAAAQAAFSRRALLDDLALELERLGRELVARPAFIRKASRPPRWSTVLSAFAEMRSRTDGRARPTSA